MIGLSKCYVYSQIFDAILIIINHLSKKHYYIPYIRNYKRTLAEVTAKLFMQYIWLREKLSINLISDCEFQFVAKMWDFFCKLFGIRAKLFIIWYPKTNNQSEIANQEMEHYLQSYINHFQNNWVCLLLMAKFAEKFKHFSINQNILIPS